MNDISNVEDSGKEALNRLTHVQHIHTNLSKKLSTLLEASGMSSTPGKGYNFLEMMEATMLSIMGNFGTRAGAVLLFQGKPRRDQVLTSLGFDAPQLQELLQALGQSGKYMVGNKPVPQEQFTSLGFPGDISGQLGKLDVRLLIPMLIQREEYGLIVLGPRLLKQGFSSEDLDLVSIITICMTMAARTVRLGDKILNLQAEKFRIRGILEEFVSPEVVEELLSEQRKETRTERKRVSCVIADIREFTAISERTEAEVLGRCLNLFYSTMSDIVRRHSGIVDKFIGDAVMAMFGGLGPSENSEMLAVEAGLALVESFDSMVRNNEEFKAVFGEIGLGVGICTGDALVGSLGSGKRIDYTAVGKPINLASRFSSLARAREVLIDAETYDRIKTHFVCKTLAPTTVRGVGEFVQIYKVLGSLQSPGARTKYQEA